MNIKEIGKGIVRNISLSGLKVKEFSPEICLGLGIATGVATVIFACKATLKADTVLDELAENKAKIEEAYKDRDKVETPYDEKTRNSDMTKAYSKAVIGFGKLYGPTIVLGAVSVGFILSSYGIIKKRNLGLIAAYTALDDRFARYRKRVIAKDGEDADREFATGITKKKVNVKTVDNETGEEKVEEREVLTMDNVELGDWTTYDRIFSKETSDACETRDVYTNEKYLRLALQHFNWLLDTRGYVYLSEVYEHLGFTVTSDTRMIGWILDPANPRAHEKIKFADTPDGMPLPSIHRGTEDILAPTGRITNCFRPTDYYLTFNVDGMIWNLTDYWTTRLGH